MKNQYELVPEQLIRIFDPTIFDFAESEAASQKQNIIGQSRAVAALQFGLGINKEGFHIYVSGPHGTGRMTAVKMFLEQIAQKQETPQDWCYVNNFDDAYRPKALALPSGKGKEFQQDVSYFIEVVKKGIPKVFQQEQYTNQRDTLIREFEELKSKKVEELKTQAGTLGFQAEFGTEGILLLPIVNGKPITDNDVQTIPPQEQEEILKKRKILESSIKARIKELRDIDQQAHEKFRVFEKEYVSRILEGMIEGLITKYKDLPLVINHLKSVELNLLDNVEILKHAEKIEQSPAFPFLGSIDTLFRKYKVNVLIDHSKKPGAPVIVDLTGSYSSLFGRIEKEAQLGIHYTDFTLIKGGSLHEANGGYLVLQVEDLLKNHFAWDSLKYALRSRTIRMEDPGEKVGLMTGISLLPESIPLNLKVILIGSSFLYSLLHAFDEDFSETFKVSADFDTRMPASNENIRSFVSFIENLCENEQINQLTAIAAAKLAQYGCRLAEDQEKLSTRFGILADIIREADHWSRAANETRITDQHIQKTIDQRLYRSGLVLEQLQEMTLRGFHLIDTEGSVVAQINGLSVFTTNGSHFGRPTRITATSGPGREGIIDIEREANLGGPIHSKGVLILSGYLSERFAQDFPLSLSARIVFEQSYSGVEGDSASCAELCALLSNLSGLPVDQGIAVTGSVNQHGKLQPIGAVNEKIEGFFDICKLRGLNGKQGVVIPKSNVQNLILRQEVIDAVKNSEFHIWALETVDQVIEILTDIPAGEFEDGSYPPGTVNSLVYSKLKKFAFDIRETSVTRIL